MFAHELSGETVAFAVRFELSKKAFFYIECSASDRLKAHDHTASFLDHLFAAVAHLHQLVDRGRQPPVGIKISDDRDTYIHQPVAELEHVELPFEMLA